MNITSSIRRMVLMNRGMLLHSLYKLQKHKLHTDMHMRCCIQLWVSFFWVHGVWIVARDKQIEWTAKRFSCDLFVPRYDSYPMNPEKRHSFLIFTMFPTRTLSKILREKFIQNSHSNGHFTSFEVLITAHVIRPNRRTFCWLCSSGIELKNFSRILRRKYDTIVNICLWIEEKKQYLSRRYAMGYIASIVKLL